MELAVHLRHPDCIQRLIEWPEHLLTLYARVFPGETDRNWQIPHAFDGIYIGDEFCPSRLPTLNELKSYCRSAAENRWGVTLLTPVLTDPELDVCSALFEFLDNSHPAAEVVVNDWGVLFFLRQHYPSIRIALGRILNKGFKDPRLLNANKLAALSAEARALLTDCTFNHADFQEKMKHLDVIRLEQDLFPYGVQHVSAACALKTSIYFPFGYITTGRVCWVASFDQSKGAKFRLNSGCCRPCSQLTLELKHNQFALRVFQNGNTVFYLYTSMMLSGLFKRTRGDDLRLVYQGCAMGI